MQLTDTAFDDLVREKSRQFRQPVLVQEFISGDEVGVPLVRLGSTYALPPMDFRRKSGELFDRLPKTFRDEHVLGDMSYASFPTSATGRQAIQDAAILAFDSIGMSGVGRIDFRVDVDGRAWAFDTNESPPPLANTSYAFAMAQLGFSGGEMLAVWLGACLIDAGIISRV